MKQKKIDKILEEFRKNGSENLKYKDSRGFWVQATAINEEVILTNISDGYKYRIKKDYIASLKESVEEPTKVSFTEREIFEEFSKNGNINLEVFDHNKSKPYWYQSSATTIEHIKGTMSIGSEYRIKDSSRCVEVTEKSIEDFGKIIEPIKERPMVFKDANISVVESIFYKGKYTVTTSLYFNTRAGAENYVNYLNTLERFEGGVIMSIYADRADIMSDCPEGAEEYVKDILDNFEGIFQDLLNLLTIESTRDLINIEEAAILVQQVCDDLY